MASLVRVYQSATGLKFYVHRHADGRLVCICKEYRESMALLADGTIRLGHTCRHIRKFKEESTGWDANPLARLDWI